MRNETSSSTLLFARRTRVAVLILAAAALLAADPARSADFPPRPDPDRAFVDTTGTVDPSVAESLEGRCQEVAQISKAPVFLVIIQSISAHGAAPSTGWRVDTYARALLERWRSGGSSKEEPAADGEAPPGDGRRSGALLVLISLGDERVAAACETPWLPRERRLRKVVKVFAHYLEFGLIETACQKGLTAVERFVQGRSVALPGGWGLALVVIAVLVLGLFTFVSWARAGPDSFALKMWRSVFSAVGLVISQLLRRGIDFGSSIASRRKKKGSEGSLTIGSW